MNRKQINERIKRLRTQEATLRNSYRDDPEYKKLEKEQQKIEKKITALKDKVFKLHAYQIARILEDIDELNMQKRARTKSALSPSAFGFEFHDWWSKLFLGISSYNKKQLIWVSEDRVYALIKIMRQTTDWYLYRTTDNQVMHHTEGRLTTIKIAAMETKIKSKIKLK